MMTRAQYVLAKSNASKRSVISSVYLLLSMIEKVLCLGKILEMESFVDLHILKSAEYENHIFSFGLYMSLRMSPISITQKRITEETPILLSLIFNTWKYYLKLFMKFGRIVYNQGNTKEFENIMVYA